MKATQKMDALGMKALLALVQTVRPETVLETLYRWRSALNSGRGIRDENKRVLVEATRDAAQPIAWADFTPADTAESEAA